ncbi:MAG: hypothetical protein ABFD10_07175 [Prolixibacteraceae bacterium]
MTEKKITRREMLINTTAFTVGSTLFLNSGNAWGNSASSKSRVVLIRDERLPDYGVKPDPALVKEMLNKGLCALVEEKDSSAAWKKIIQPSDIVGIKTNVWQTLPTPPELETAIKEELIGTGVASENISINDRGIRRDPVFQNATALINTRPMRTHAWSGVGTLIKNYIMFAEKPSDLHPDSCADLASVWNLPNVKGKTRLNILVMFTPQFSSVGPHSFSADYVWSYKGLLIGFDPVAVDSVGLRIIQAKRNDYFKEDRPLNPPAKHIEIADTRHHLGTADPAKIELIKLGWGKDLLV